MGFFTEIKTLDQINRFDVEKVQVYDANRNEVPGAFSLQRTDTGQHLGMVGKSYRPIQLEEMLDVLNTASEEIGGIDHVGYAESKGGRKIVIQSKLAESLNIDGDKIDPYFYTVIDNTGMGSNKVIPSTVRIACDNAFHLIRSNETAETRAHHSSAFSTRVDSMTDHIISSVNTARDFSGIVEKLKGIKFSKDEMVKLTQKLLPVEKDESARRANKRERLVELFSAGRGNVGETRWDAFNAITEFETHNGRRSPEKLIRNLSGPTMSRSALKLLAA
jgi:hypothetical protein